MTSNRQLNSSITTTNVLFRGITKLMQKRTTPLVGTMTDLQNTLEHRLANLPIDWPRSPSAFRVALNRIINRLRHAGISVRFDRSKQRLVRFSTR
jgi:hypothetical protein